VLRGRSSPRRAGAAVTALSLRGAYYDTMVDG
jgi:hypothetical protein